MYHVSIGFNVTGIEKKAGGINTFDVLNFIMDR